MFKYILNRLTERSTWLGVIGLIVEYNRRDMRTGVKNG